MALTTHNAQPIANLATWSPPQRRRDDGDGGVIIEKLPPQPSLLMVDLAGNECAVPLSNGIANRSPDDPYRRQKLQEKQADGWVRVDQCPLGVNESIPHLPKVVRYEAGADGKPDEDRPKYPCTRGANGGPISLKNPCKCIAALTKVRRERNAVKDAAQEERIGRVAKMQERTAQANQDAAVGLAEAAKALAAVASSRKGGKEPG